MAHSWSPVWGDHDSGLVVTNAAGQAAPRSSPGGEGEKLSNPCCSVT
jgi:hypothetical protein